ncbi:TPA: hypothetical protein HNW47_23380 [Escherichia coli]|nr:hypothetical protein [Escherichia coli]
MTIFKENIVDTSLIGPILTALLAAAGFYCKFWFTSYQASRDQAQKVSRAIEDVLSKMAALFGQKKPARILREEFSAVIAPLHQEMRILDDMTSRLPLKWLQREQRHVLYHARWLQRYLDSRRGGSDGDFFLLLHDVAMGTDYQVADILASQHDCKQRRGSQLPVNLKTCP